MPIVTNVAEIDYVNKSFFNLFWLKNDLNSKFDNILCCATPSDTLRFMDTYIYQELEHLTIAQRRSVGEALISSAESEASAPLISERQRSELRSRLSDHRAHPGEPGVSFADLKAKLLAAT
jgi:hypothetical protein